MYDNNNSCITTTIVLSFLLKITKIFGKMIDYDIITWRTPQFTREESAATEIQPPPYRSA